mgnify:FL=1|uniref:Uncharacterized protein n=1 Tax=viral metagenome TaxID=1070528 RepID=A0A6C0AXU0_9ZZZZ|tara:strand:+ start:15031 stop:15960 length:930 start_codon:yes stop_codon:yes gene_type:complete
MADKTSNEFIIDGVKFNPNEDYSYTKPKVNASGGKSIGIISNKTKKALYLSTPLMLTWGVNEFVDNKTGRKSYDMSLQFPKEEYNTPEVNKFLESMKQFEAKIKADAIVNCKEWMNKPKMSAEVVDALWTRMLKYPKDKETGEFDYSRPPTLRIKFSFWDDEWKCELYDMEQKQIFPNEEGLFPNDLIVKATNVATVITCGGLWNANGKFGVTWKLLQAVVKPKASLKGQCYINLSPEDIALMNKSKDSDSDEEDEAGNNGVSVNVVDSSDDEEIIPSVAEEVAEVVAAAPVPSTKKKVVRKKKATETD